MYNVRVSTQHDQLKLIRVQKNFIKLFLSNHLPTLLVACAIWYQRAMKTDQLNPWLIFINSFLHENSCNVTSQKLKTWFIIFAKVKKIMWDFFHRFRFKSYYKTRHHNLNVHTWVLMLDNENSFYRKLSMWSNYKRSLITRQLFIQFDVVKPIASDRDSDITRSITFYCISDNNSCQSMTA